MGESSQEIREFYPDSFALLLFSHLKLNDIDKVDVLELAYILTDLFYVNEISFVLRDFKMRETIKHTPLLDIDTMLMSAYFLGYLEMGTQRILLGEDYIKENVIPNYSKDLNETFKYISKKYTERIKNDQESYNKDFIGNLLYNHNLRSRKRKNSDDV